MNSGTVFSGRLAKWVSIWAVWTLVGLFLTSQVALQSQLSQSPVSFLRILSWQLFSGYVWFAISPIILWLGRDIQIPEKNGFDVIKSLNGKSLPTVIFVTAYDQYALQAFDVHALDYLLKPFNRERIHRAVVRAREHIEHKSLGNLDERLASLIADLRSEKKYLERLVVKSVGRVFFLKTDEIEWIEAFFKEFSQLFRKILPCKFPHRIYN